MASNKPRATPPIPTSISLACIQRKLDRWELNHLRQHAAELADRLEQAEQSLEVERASADAWRENCFELMQELQDNGETLGLTQSGVVGVMA